MAEKINFSKYLLEKYGIDDSNFAIPFGEVDVIDDRFDSGGPIVAVNYIRDPEICERCRRNLIEIATRSALSMSFKAEKKPRRSKAHEVRSENTQSSG